MHITVYCPECESRYHLDPSVRGKFMRCTNAACRKVFEVREAEPKAPMGGTPDPEPKQPRAPEGGFQLSSQTGSVGELVPILPAEEVAEAPPPASPSAPASWQEPPPVRQRPARATPKPPRAPQPEPPPLAPVAPPPPPPAPSWETAPPPVRKSGNGAPASRVPAPVASAPEPARTWEAPPTHPPDAEAPPAEASPEGAAPAPPTGAAIVAARRRRARWIMVSLVGLMLAAAGGVVGLVLHSLAQSEEERYQTALADFDQANYVKAAESFQRLAKDFPESPRAKEYRFLEEYSRSLQPAQELGANPHEALQAFLQFLDAHQADPLLEARRAPAGAALVRIAENLTAVAGQALEKPPDVNRAKQVLQEARRALAEARRYGAGDETKIAAAIQDVDDRIALAERRSDLLQKLAALDPTPDNIARAEEMAHAANLADDPEVVAVITAFKEKVLAKIGYTPAQEGNGALVRRRRSGAPGLVTVTPVTDAAPAAGRGVVFAIARGVLYALAAGDGRLLWATRVGIDSTTLPVRVPPTETTRELVLVVSAEPPAVTARDLQTGEERWHFHLPAPCLGRPVVVDGRAFIPTLAGRIYDIDVAADQLRGWYDVGSRLTVGGAHPEASNLVYFPADSLQVYVLDISQNKCVDILRTGHPAGSLRTEPIVAGLGMGSPAAAGEPARRGYLILDEADGFGGTRLRALPVGAGQGTAPAAVAELTLSGLSWFPPCCDGEKLAVATDTGAFGLFGINQVHNDDPPLFRYVPEGAGLTGGAAGRPQGRAQVVHAGENDFWLLIRGQLSHWQLGFDRRHGLHLAPGWKLAEPLGWPLHAGQVSPARNQLFVVTRALNGSTCLATAVSAPTGRIRWQRRLGTVADTDPLVVNGQVLTQDREGGLYLFDPGHDSPSKDQEWRLAGRLLAPPVKDAGGGPRFLLPGADNGGAVSIVSAANRTRLEVRWYQDGRVTTQTFTPGQPLAGTPGIGSDYLLLPLADGSLVWQGLNGTVRYGTWRTPQTAGTPAAPHVVHLAPEKFLATDGLRTLARWSWPANNNTPRAEKTRVLPARIVAAPLVLPDGDVCVALAGGSVQLLKGDTLQTQWQGQVSGEITAGPYRLGNAIACVVNHRQLVWFDPADGKSRKFPEAPAPDAIVGRPQLAGGVLVLANLRGNILGVDPQTGKAVGKGVALPAGVAPAGTPVAFGPGHVFVPLSDGTALLAARADLAR